ncbi:MAG: hypothetical protein ABSF22_14365 [Bryobacteraceae bacterium]
MLFVTFHGGSSASKGVPCPVNNVYAYDETGTSPIQPYLNVLSVPASVPLSELRAMCFANGYLYVANGSKKVTDVLCFKQSSETTNPLFLYVSTFVSNSVNSIAHPFGICFDTGGHAYVSSQDTNVVTQLNVATDFKTGSAVSGNAASYLTSFGTGFLNGTFVASHEAVPGYSGTPKVDDKKGGLDFSLTSGAISNSVRDVVICNGILCVADEVEQMVKMYDLTSGTFLGASAKLPSGPIHLLVQGQILYAGVGAAVYSGLPSGSSLTLSSVLTASDEVSGICFDGSGNFYVALRKENAIYQYDQSFKNGKELLANLPDNPEFVVWQVS